MNSDRIPCINPSCRRTAPREKHEDDEEIVCAKCWKLLPKRLTVRYRALRKREKKLLKLIDRKVARHEISSDRINDISHSLWQQMRANWVEIRSFFLRPEKPEGLDSFLEGIGMND